MHRRSFIKQSALLLAGSSLRGNSLLWASKTAPYAMRNDKLRPSGLYNLFQSPHPIYRPFVRWWWNGDKVEAEEIIRELHVLHDAGIGGVEINPIKFPGYGTDDLGKKSLLWLSDEWIDMLKVAFDEAKALNMACDLIVGSGWPYGGEFLSGNERADIVVNYSEKLEGPIEYEVSRDGIFTAANPAISSPFLGKRMELLSLLLVPEPLANLDQAIDLMDTESGGTFRFQVPDGRYVLFALVRIQGFLKVINGAPGATGPVLNHFNRSAVKKYLYNMSNKIQQRIGPLSNYIRALFTDSMELEGANWSDDMADEFIKRRGYDVRPYLPFILFKIGNMGNALTYEPKVELTPELDDTMQRVRYDFEFTKAELLYERFTKTCIAWCKELNVKSRAQAYGRGFFPLKSSLDYDIPECESWTMTWLRHRLGEEMSEDDYRRGRAYTMINKYVSSAAHLRGKRLISCEEMTNTYTVFNMTLELLKIGGDQTAISGVTHAVFHGFNYSPTEAPFPGWIRYGAYYNEHNTWWPYFKYYTAYKGRLSSVLQHASMYARIAILNPIADMWSILGMQNEPFPSKTHVEYKTLIWEAIHKNGDGCDYISEEIIRDSEIQKGCLCYGPRKFHTIFLIEVERMEPATAHKLYNFVSTGGRVFCIELYPHLSPGLTNHQVRDAEVQDWVSEMKKLSTNFILVKKPEKDFIRWYQNLQWKYDIEPYLTIDKPDPYLMQNRYQGDQGEEIFFFSYAHRYNSHCTRITFSPQIVKDRYGWIWDLETGERYRLKLDSMNSYVFDFGPADSLFIVFDREKKGKEYLPLPAAGNDTLDLSTDWELEFRHALEKSIVNTHLDELKDLKDTTYATFCGTIVYKKKVNIVSSQNRVLNLGLVHGVTEVFVNGKACGVKWYGRRIHRIADFLNVGENRIEVHVITVMGNYMKSLKDNKVAQLWMKKQEELQPLGLAGPVTIYTI